MKSIRKSKISFSRKFLESKESGAASLFVGLMVAATVFLFMIPNMWLKTEQYVQVSALSTAKEIGYTANLSAVKYFVELLESEKIYICGHNVLADDPDYLPNCTQANADIKRMFLNGNPTNNNYIFTSIAAAGANGTFSVCSPDPSRLQNDAGNIYGGAAFTIDSHVQGTSTCQVTINGKTKDGIFTRLDIEQLNPPNGDYLKINATTNVKSSATETTQTMFASRFLMPDTCGTSETVTIEDEQPFKGYKMTHAKRPKHIKDHHHFRRMKHGGHYELDNDIELSASEFHRHHHFKHIFFHGRGHKIKIKRNKGHNKDCQDDDIGGVVRTIDCGVITDAEVEIVDDPTDPDPDDINEKGGVCGRKCVGGIVGRIRRALVSNSHVFSSPGTRGSVRGHKGVGGVVGCIDNCGFWHSRVTRILAEAVLRARKGYPDSDNIDIEDFGGAIGVNKGFVEGVYTVGQLIGFLKDIGIHGIKNFGGVAGRDGGKAEDRGHGGYCHDNHKDKDVPGYIKNSKSETNIVDYDEDTNDDVKHAINKAGGICGNHAAGKIEDSFYQTNTSSGNSVKVHGNDCGGAIGIIKPDNGTLVRDPETNGKDVDNKSKIDKCHANVDVGVSEAKIDSSKNEEKDEDGDEKKGENRGGLVGTVDTQPTKSNPGSDKCDVKVKSSYGGKGSTRHIYGKKNTGGLIGLATNVGGTAIELEKSYAYNQIDCSVCEANKGGLVGNADPFTTTCSDNGNATDSCFYNVDLNPGLTDTVTKNDFTSTNIDNSEQSPPDITYDAPSGYVPGTVSNPDNSKDNSDPVIPDPGNSF